MNEFLSGALMMCFVAISLFFARFWISTKDKLFASFSISFAVLAIERLCLIELDPAHEARSFVYVARLLAFILIIYAIVDKNKNSGKGSSL